jgi:hypothetical protein
MITNEDIKEALGSKYDPKVNYRIAEQGPQLGGKLGRGYKVVGRLDDNLTASGTEMFIIKPPAGEK